MNKLESVWVQDAPATTYTPQRIATFFAWPAAALIVLHTIFVRAWTGSLTDDFTTVWSAARRFVERVPVYDEIYQHVDPHYLYNPGATLLLSPLGLFSDIQMVRPLFIITNAIAMIIALALLTRRAGFSLTHPVFPAAIAIAFLTESVTNTLVFSNVNGALLLALVVFLELMLRQRPWIAGLVLGVAIVIKPMFAPLIILPLMKLNWKTPAAAISVPAVLNIVAWPLTPGASDYVNEVVPYLGTTRDYANASLAGIGAYFGIPGWLHAIMWLTIAAAVAVSVLGLARFRYSDPWMWSAVSAGVLIVGVSLLSSLGQAYYSMMIFPALFTVFGRLSPMHTAGAWLGAVICLSPLEWKSWNFPNSGALIDWVACTVGWSIFTLAVAAWTASVTLSTKETDNDKATRTLQRVDRAAMAGEA